MTRDRILLRGVMLTKIRILPTESAVMRAALSGFEPYSRTMRLVMCIMLLINIIHIIIMYKYACLRSCFIVTYKYIMFCYSVDIFKIFNFTSKGDLVLHRLNITPQSLLLNSLSGSRFRSSGRLCEALFMVGLVLANYLKLSSLAHLSFRAKLE